jgi:3'(2'), 5'-bisphosphate nucleotidase
MIDTSSRQWLPDLLSRIVVIAREAGSAIMALYNARDPVVATKADSSLLTEADLRSHEVIVKGLAKLNPEWPILSEEGPEISFAEREVWDYFWLIDPLDGTKEFLGRNDEFTVNVALIERHAPILGVVYAPALGCLYSAAKGMGAWKSNDHGQVQICVGKTGNQRIRVMVSRSHRGPEELLSRELLSRVSGVSNNLEFVAMGSSLKFCLVAEGVADFYPRTGRTMEWDTAAAQCILEEAGGKVVDLEGSSISYNKPMLFNSGFLAQGTALSHSLFALGVRSNL